MRLVYYSLANFPHDSRERQWIQSIRSLRRYNQSIPVWLFIFNGASRELLGEAERWNVRVHSLGVYEEFLRRVHPRGSILALYPTFHKFLVLPKLPRRDLTQVLYLDCDTFFFDDVDLLFERYTAQDWYAREEPLSRRSEHGYNPGHVNEDLLQTIARDEGLRYILPFNSGVCLMNHRIWQSMDRLRDAYLDLVWRLLCGREVNRDNGDEHDRAVQHAITEVLTEAEQIRALPYPSANDWIIEQIALWLALGRLPRFSLGTLLPSEVSQGCEFSAMLTSGHRGVLAHYFTGAEQAFFAAVSAIAA